MVHDFIYKKCPELTNQSCTLERRAGRLRGWGLTAKGYRIALGVAKNVLILVMVAQL